VQQSNNTIDIAKIGIASDDKKQLKHQYFVDMLGALIL
jgi:hypothetical protein